VNLVLEPDEDGVTETQAEGTGGESEPESTSRYVNEKGEAHAEARPIDRFRSSAVGSVMAAGLLGLRDVFEPPKDEEPAIVVDWSGAPPFTDPYVLRLDPDHPEDSIVMVRPWLRRGDALASDGDAVEHVEPNGDAESGTGRDA
jgi:hypothetical protein